MSTQCYPYLFLWQAPFIVCTTMGFVTNHFLGEKHRGRLNSLNLLISYTTMKHCTNVLQPECFS